MVFTDLEAYTQRVAQTDREGLRKILQDHAALVTPVVEKFGGRIVKNLGDSFLCLFPSATDALRAALDVQRLAAGAAGIKIRLAMTTGDVEEIEGDAFGEAVNLASRILSKTPAGEIWFGPGTRVCMNASEIPWESVGRFTLKGIQGDKELYRAVPPDRAWLPKVVEDAIKKQTLVRFKRGGSIPMLPPDPVVLLEGYAPGSPALMAAIDALPRIDPGKIWLVTYNISGGDRAAWLGEGRGVVVGTPDAIEIAVREVFRTSNRTSGSDTIVIETQLDVVASLVLAGLALPSLPMADVVAGYSYDLERDGKWANRSDAAVLRVDVSPTGVVLQSLAPNVSVNGRAIPPGDQVQMRDGATIGTPSGDLRFVIPDQGYAGLLLADTKLRLPLPPMGRAELGREPAAPGLPFLDRRGQDNIRWCPGPRAQRARAGGFTLDRAMAGRRQAIVEVESDGIRVTTAHDRCTTWLLRSTAGNRLEKVEPAAIAWLDDLIVAGTAVVAIRSTD